MSTIGKRERALIALCKELGGKLTKKEAVQVYGCWYYHNAGKWIGEILARLVKRGVFEREKPGVYIFRKTPLKSQCQGAIQGPGNQTNLF